MTSSPTVVTTITALPARTPTLLPVLNSETAKAIGGPPFKLLMTDNHAST